jgi:hypothetical protein
MHDHEMFSWMMNSDSNWLNPSFKTSEDLQLSQTPPPAYIAHLWPSLTLLSGGQATTYHQENGTIEKSF